MSSQQLYLGFLALIAAERVGELMLSGCHARRVLAKGGVEVGCRHICANGAFAGKRRLVPEG